MNIRAAAASVRSAAEPTNVPPSPLPQTATATTAPVAETPLAPRATKVACLTPQPPAPSKAAERFKSLPAPVRERFELLFRDFPEVRANLPLAALAVSKAQKLDEEQQVQVESAATQMPSLHEPRYLRGLVQLTADPRFVKLPVNAQRAILGEIVHRPGDAKVFAEAERVMLTRADTSFQRLNAGAQGVALTLIARAGGLPEAAQAQLFLFLTCPHIHELPQGEIESKIFGRVQTALGLLGATHKGKDVTPLDVAQAIGRILHEARQLHPALKAEYEARSHDQLSVPKSGLLDEV